MLQILLIMLMTGCTSTNSLVNDEPHSLVDRESYLYTLENSDGSKTEVKSHLTGILTNMDYENLKSHLKDISNKELDFNKRIIINYIDNDPRIYRKNYQVPWDIFYGNMEADLAKFGKANHFWVINKGVTDLHYYHGDKIKWIEDKNNVVRKLFFAYDGLNGGFVIIKPNGEYFLNIGEYTKSNFLETHKEF